MARMPAVFVGHGSPMNALADNDCTRSLRDLAAAIPQPRAVAVISAHWQTRGTRVTAAERPRQIYDMYGFPDELYRIRYEPVGHPEAAHRAHALLGGDADDVRLDDSWGHDHAGWTVLKHMYPAADVPTFHISVDMAASYSRHVELGRRLAPLRDEGVLLLGSGNVVHNLFAIDWNEDAPADPRGVAFNAHVRAALLAGDVDALTHPERRGAEASFSVPTRDHYLPLLPIVGARLPDDTPRLPCQLFQNASISMLSFVTAQG
jgi:4,5-DOPA dioxygenase extradiol